MTKTFAEYKEDKATRKANRPLFSERLFTPGTVFRAPDVAKQYDPSTDVVFTVKDVGQSTPGNWIINYELIPGFNDCGLTLMSTSWVTEIISRGNHPWTIESNDYYQSSAMFFGTNPLCFTSERKAKRKMGLTVKQVLKTKNLGQVDDFCTSESIYRKLGKDGFFKSIKKVALDKQAYPGWELDFVYVIDRPAIKRLKKWTVANQRRILDKHSSAEIRDCYFDDSGFDLDIYGEEKDYYGPELDLYSDKPGLRDVGVLDIPKVLEEVPQSTTAKETSWDEIKHYPGGIPKGAPIYVTGSYQPRSNSESTSPRLSDEFVEDDHDFGDDEGAK